MHALVVDSETGEVLLDEDVDLNGDPIENREVAGSDRFGVCYFGVKLWVADAVKTHAWEPDAVHVFIQWKDRSNSAGKVSEVLQTSERPVPGGGIGRFLVTVE